MLCSFLSRNALIVSGVITIHVLFFALLVFSSFKVERSLTSEFMKVNLVNLGTDQPSRRKDASKLKTTAIASAENVSAKPFEEASLSGDEGGSGDSFHLTPRQVLHNPKPNYPLLSKS